MKKTYKPIRYKSLLRLKDIFYPNKRILNFKRPKWSYLKKVFFFKFIKRNANKGFFTRKPKALHNQFVLVAPLKWVYLKRTFKNSILAKLRVLSFFKLKTPSKILKQYYLKGDTLEQLECRLDIILWRAGFFETPAVARFFINHKNVCLNDTPLNLPNQQIKEGDVISLKSTAKTYVSNFFSKKKLVHTKMQRIFVDKHKLLYSLAPYLEINSDMLEIVCLGSYNKFSNSYLLYNTNLEISLINSYLKQL